MNFLIYDAKVAVLIVVFYMFYRLMLSRETFHRVNRVVLLLTAIASFVLPLCVITLHKTVTLAVRPTVSVGEFQVGVVEETRPELWQMVLPYLFIIGVVLTLGHTVGSIVKVMLLIRKSERHPQPDGTIVCVTGNADVSPFSWMRYIVMNRDDYEAQDAAILAHERGHIRLRHSWDVVLVDLLTALQWFNPAMWMLRQDLRAIHEYEADGEVLSQGINARQYQYLLISKASGIGGYSIANGISHSTLKNRITMMLHKKSNRTSLLKLFVLIPIVGLALALNARTVTNYVYDEPQKQQPVKKGQKAGTIKMGNQEIKVVENNKPVTFQTVLVPNNYPMDGVPVEVVVDGKVIQTTETDAKGKVTLTPPIGATVRFITKMLEEDPYSDDVTEIDDTKEVVITKAMVEQAGVKKITFGNNDVPEKAFDVVEQMPEFPGGAKALLDYLNKNVNYPKQAFDAGIEGRVIVTFVVDKDGTVRNAKLVKSVDPALDNEALRVINAMPKWTPGRQSGKEVAVKFTVPISFHQQGDDKPKAEGSFTPTAEGSFTPQTTGTFTQKSEGMFISGNPNNLLCLVDGKEVPVEKFTKMDPKTIKNIEILKDKASIEKYGEKGKDGVILVTTKK